MNWRGNHPIFRFWSRGLVLFGISTFSLLFPAPTNEPWLNEAFFPDARASLAAAQKVAVDGTPNIHILLEDTTYRWDKSGRRTLDKRLVYRVLSAKGVEEWSTVRYAYRPWHENKPVIQARVITPDGNSHPLDLSTLTEAKVGEQSQNVFSDRVDLVGPLPAVAPGCLVEERVTITEHTPYFEAGESIHLMMGFGYPSFRSRLRLVTPKDMPMAVKFDLLSNTITNVLTEKDFVTRLYDLGALAPRGEVEAFLGSETPRLPTAHFSTGKSWQAVAKAYHQMVSPSWKAFVTNLPATAAPVGPEARQRAIAGALREVHRQLRYTGVEFGRNSIVPRNPEICLQAKYGDCKEKGSLLVALLAAQKIEARLALLSTGPGVDISEDMPGLGQFDHVIVVIPGPEPLWIDATDEFGRPGELPYMDQGRKALIVDPSTTGLVVTPLMPSTSNIETEERRIVLSAYGPARVVERTTYTGAKESSLRDTYGGDDTNKIMENLVKYARDVYGAKVPPVLRHHPAHNFSNRFFLELEVESAPRFFTELMEVTVPLELKGLFEDLADVFQHWGQREEGPEDESEKKVVSRQRDWVMSFTSVKERIYRITPPPGFRIKSLPEGEKLDMGPGHFTRTYRALPDGTVEAELRFDMGPHRFSADRGRQLREAMESLGQKDRVFLEFVHEGYLLLDEGKSHQAMDLFRKGLRESPTQAISHMRYAQGALDCGFGDLARAGAREGVRLDSNSAMGWVVLGRALGHNSLGLYLQPGMDFGGAVSAYEKAIAIDSNHHGAKLNLAILLEHDPSGVRYAPGANLARAAAAYATIQGDLAGEYQRNLPLLYLHMRKPKECLETIKKMASGSPETKVISLAATAMREGAAAAVKQLGRDFQDDGERSKILQSVAYTLAGCREYALASSCLSLAARSAANPAQILEQAALYKKATNLDSAVYDARTAEGRVRQFLHQLFAPDVPVTNLFSFFPSSMQREYQHRGARQYFSQQIHQARNVFAAQNLSPYVGRDLTLANMQVTLTGGEKPWARAQVRFPRWNLNLILVKEGNQWRLMDSFGGYRGVGLEVQAMMGRGEWAGARDLLDYVREEISGGGEGRGGSPFLDLWKAGATNSQLETEIAAASLAVTSLQSPKSIDVLHQALLRNTNAEKKNALESSLIFGAFMQKRHDLLRDLSKKGLAKDPENLMWLSVLQDALGGLKHWAEADSAVKAALEKFPRHLGFIRKAANLKVEQGLFAESIPLFQKAAAHADAQANDWNLLAWFEFFLDTVPEDAVEEAQRACTMTQNRNAAYLHTLSVALAEAGKVREARALLTQLVQTLGVPEDDAGIWYLVGRLAEATGEKEFAGKAYRETIRASHAEPGERNDLAVLSEKRLRVMK